MSRILIIGAAIIVVGGLAFFLYERYLSNSPGLAVSPTSTTLPTAGSVASGRGGASTSTNTPGALAATAVTERLVRISQGPVAPGAAVLDLSSATSSSASSTGPVNEVQVRFVERQSGNIFSYLVHAGKLTRTSNRTLPGIQRATWLTGGESALLTYLSGDTLSIINTYLLRADGSGGLFLPQGLVEVSTSPSGILALASGANGSLATLNHADGTGTMNLFSSPLSSLRVVSAGKGYVAFTKPSSSLPGNLFSVDTSGAFTRIAGPLSGLIALPSHAGTLALMSSSSGGTLHMVLVDTKSGATTPLPIATIADKCVWAADDSAVYCAVPVAPPVNYSYPDDWYQGAVHFTDRLWKISVAVRYAQLVLDPGALGVGPIDAEALAIDQSGTTLVFVNKTDGSLWSYQL